MSKSIKLKELLFEILTELGDGENIINYPYEKISNNKYKFTTEQNEIVKVNFMNLNLSLINIPNDPTYPTYTNIGFTIDDSETQLKKSNLPYLLKIIKTVFEITLDYLKSNKPKYMLISSTNKDDAKSMEEFDQQKNKLYQAVVLKNISKIDKGWKYKILDDVYGIQGESILLYNENK